MKKLLILIGIIILAFCACIFGFNATKKNNAVGDDKSAQQESDVEAKKILIKKYYFNCAWGFSYRGKAIFSDGSIYEWNYSNSVNNENININDVEWIIKNGTMLDKKVSNRDLEKIKLNIDNLQDNIELNGVAMDFGSYYIASYKNNEEIVLIESGDSEGENTTKESQQLIKIAEKYLGKISSY